MTIEHELELHRIIGGIASDTKHILENLGVQTRRLDAHSDRIKSLEQSKWRVIGMATAAGVLFPLLIGVVEYIILSN